METCETCKNPVQVYSQLHPTNTKIQLEIESPSKVSKIIFGSMVCLAKWMVEHGT